MGEAGCADGVDTQREPVDDWAESIDALMDGTLEDGSDSDDSGYETGSDDGTMEAGWTTGAAPVGTPHDVYDKEVPALMMKYDAKTDDGCWRVRKVGDAHVNSKAGVALKRMGNRTASQKKNDSKRAVKKRKREANGDAPKKRLKDGHFQTAKRIPTPAAADFDIVEKGRVCRNGLVGERGNKDELKTPEVVAGKRPRSVVPEGADPKLQILVDAGFVIAPRGDGRYVAERRLLWSCSNGLFDCSEPLAIPELKDERIYVLRPAVPKKDWDGRVRGATEAVETLHESLGLTDRKVDGRRGDFESSTAGYSLGGGQNVSCMRRPLDSGELVWLTIQDRNPCHFR